MTSLEGLIRELFLKPKAWRTVLWGGLAMYILLAFGYLRRLAVAVKGSGEVALPSSGERKDLLKSAFSALPLGAFYTLVPLVIAWGVTTLFGLLLLSGLNYLIWGAATLMSLTLTSIALVHVPDDAERFFLGLEFELVLAQWWKLKRFYWLPAIASYGFVALMGPIFYGGSLFIALIVLTAYNALVVRNQKYA